jgi:hypothetical protein
MKSQQFPKIVISLFWIYPVALCLNIIICSLLSKFVNIDFVLNSKYSMIYPNNEYYTVRLTSLNVDRAEIEFVNLSMANGAAISYLFGILYFFLGGILIPFIKLKYNIITKSPNINAIFAVFFGSLLCFGYIYTANFEKTSILYKLSVYRPLIFSVLILNIFLYSFVCCFSFGIAMLFGRLIDPLLSSIIRK